jgi:SAM-dependent methyltransferase
LFHDNAFDLFITQDVFENLPFPDRAFNEVMRTLRPGGAHLFTVPWWPDRDTVIRAESRDGVVIHGFPPDYHGNPIDASGSLVYREWGKDLQDYIAKATGGLRTQVLHFNDKRHGLAGEHLWVFVTRKPACNRIIDAGDMRRAG